MAWEKLFTAANELEAKLITGLLSAAGIPYRYRYSDINRYLKIVMGPVVDVEIWIPGEKMAQAREIIRAFRENGPEVSS